MTKYELDHMPETKAGKRMYARVSPVYENSLFMKRFYDALGAKWDKLREFFTSLREQHFIDTVDWGIEYLEHKYSLEPRPDLTLEERRARLGIKARTHRPLNPAVIERHIREEFGLNTYLSEDEPGYIHLFANWLTEDGWRRMIPWLLEEKPAHLVLDATLNIVIYTGGKPDEPFDNTKIILPGEIALPKTPKEKKQYRRISVGNPLIHNATTSINLPKVKGSKLTAYVGNIIMHNATTSVDRLRPRGSLATVYAGCPLIINRQIWIDAKREVARMEPPIADLAISY